MLVATNDIKLILFMWFTFILRFNHFEVHSEA